MGIRMQKQLECRFCSFGDEYISAMHLNWIPPGIVSSAYDMMGRWSEGPVLSYDTSYESKPWKLRSYIQTHRSGHPVAQRYY